MTQTMSHIVKSCPLTKLNGGLSRLHSADEDAVSWLASYMVHDTHTRRRRLGFMVRKTVQSERHTKFVDLSEFGGLQTPKTPCYGPANSNVNELVMVQLRPLQKY